MTRKPRDTAKGILIISGRFVPADNMAYYPLEIYVIEKENAIFIEYAYNSALYSEYDILYFNNLLNTALLKLNNYE